MPVPKRFLLQPIDIGEVADRLVELALADPAGRVPDVGGPEVRTLAELARAYLGATGRRRRVPRWAPILCEPLAAVGKGETYAPKRDFSPRSSGHPERGI